MNQLVNVVWKNYVYIVRPTESGEIKGREKMSRNDNRIGDNNQVGFSGHENVYGSTVCNALRGASLKKVKKLIHERSKIGVVKKVKIKGKWVRVPYSPNWDLIWKEM